MSVTAKAKEPAEKILPARGDGPNPFKNAGEKKWMLKVQHPVTGKWSSRSTGMRDEDAAKRVAKLLWRLRGEGHPLSKLVATGDVKLRDLETHLGLTTETVTVDGAFEERSLSGRANDVVKKLKSRTLSDIIDQWEEFRRKQNKDLKYCNQVRAVIPKGSLLGLDWFTAANIQNALESLDVDSNNTRVRYRTAFSQFAKYMLKKGIIAFNPVVKGGVEVELTRDEIEAREEPKFWWEAEVKRMLSKMEPGSTIEALCALMFATGMEWQSAERLHKEEFLNMETREVRAFGNKTKYRNRIVVVVMDWCWDIVKRYVDNLEKGEWFLPRARDGKSKNACEGTLRDELDAAIQAAGLERHTFHNFRHSFATHWVSRGALLGALEGIDEQFLKEQLGHRDNSQELRTTYSKYNTQARIKERAPVVFQTAREQTEKEQSSKHSAFRFGRAKKSA